MRDSILIVGSVNLDLVIRAPRIPVPGENIYGAQFLMVPGGKGANQAVASRRLGNATILLGRLGKDFFGDYLLEELEESGVDTSCVKRTDARSSGVAMIVVEDPTGENTIVIDPGANLTLTTGDLDSLETYYDRADSVIFQLEIPIEVVLEGARRAGAKGVKTVLDAGPPRGLELDSCQPFDVVSPNTMELAQLTGRSLDGIESISSAARMVLEAGAGMVVVKMGGDGSMLVTDEGAWHVHPFKVNAVDATAAGDAFTAALATGLSEGMEPLDVLAFANAAGAAAVTVMGAQPSMPTREHVETLMRLQEVECTSL